ncbi:hypothetical protein BQ1740_0101 [Bacillus subtilis]|nr:hypothetical protein BQ1740_0101 [Bacillus subtilis]
MLAVPFYSAICLLRKMIKRFAPCSLCHKMFKCLNGLTF